MASEQKMYRLIGRDGKEYLSPEKGEYGAIPELKYMAAWIALLQCDP